MQQADQKTIKESIEKVIVYFDKQIALLDASIKTMIDAHPDWSEKDKIIQSVPGVGGKSKFFKIAIVADMRKLITILNVMEKMKTCRQEQKTNCERK